MKDSWTYALALDVENNSGNGCFDTSLRLYFKQKMQLVDLCSSALSLFKDKKAATVMDLMTNILKEVNSEWTEKLLGINDVNV